MAKTTEHINYQQAPEPLNSILNTPFSPASSLSPDRQTIAFLEHRSLPDIAELSEKELRLAGVRINPENFSPSRSWFYTSIKLQKTQSGQEQSITGLPHNARLSNLLWSPDAKQLAFTHTGRTEVSLWVIDVTTRQARRLGSFGLNKTYGSPFVWASDSKSLICKAISKDIPLPANDQLPQGPIIMENIEQRSPGRTYQDLLKTPQDIQRFKHYLNSQLITISLNGEVRTLGKPGAIIAFQPSPDGDFLLVKQLQEPFSYMFPVSRFPLMTMIWNKNGTYLKTIADLPLANNIPISFDAVRVGRRRIAWRADADATLYWVEALDQGNPQNEILWRERLYQWEAPFSKEPKILLDLKQRFNGIYWKNDHFALVYSDWYQSRQQNIWLIQPGTKAPPKLVKSFSSEDRYQLPGHPLLEKTPQGTSILMTQKNQQTLLLKGQGASPEGDQPFLDSWNPLSGESKRLWRSKPPHYEQLIQVLNPDKLSILIRRESKELPANYLLKNLENQTEIQLTHFTHPFPDLAQVQKQLIEYQRKDGVKLNATLYLPPKYKKEDGPLPTIFWAYPREFKNPKAAGQVKGSPHSFVRISAWSPLIFVTQGYAVVDQPAMPIIGENNHEPNDTFVEQLVDSAQAAVDKLVEMGVSDPEKLAIGGHSYGAFMTANLLAHSDIFKVGIARSGAYNRTLTPFGFQSEQRSLWQTPETYLNMSPLMHAHKIKEPLLLIHGEEDNNSGTYPMQSKNFYQALKGLGAPVRLVLLPYESHSYRAKESLGHTLWEMVRWLDIHLKNNEVKG